MDVLTLCNEIYFQPEIKRILIQFAFRFNFQTVNKQLKEFKDKHCRNVYNRLWRHRKLCKVLHATLSSINIHSIFLWILCKTAMMSLQKNKKIGGLTYEFRRKN